MARLGRGFPARFRQHGVITGEAVEAPVTETPTFGGATAGGVAPTARVVTVAAGATGQGNTPAPRTILTSQGATGQGTAPTGRTGVTAGGALGQGTGPGAGVPPAPGGGGAGGTGATARVILTSQGAVAGGNAPGVPVYETPTFGGATAGGTGPLAVVGVPPGGAVTVQGGSSEDNFNRSDETPLVAGPWYAHFDAGASMDLVDNHLEANTSGDKVYYYAGAATTADHWSEVRVSTDSVDGGPAVRIGSGGAATAYVTNCFGGTVLNIGKIISGSFTPIGTGATDIQDDDLIRLEAIGNQLHFYVNGVEDANSPITDNSLSGAGLGVGVFLYESFGGVDYLDDWSGGDVGAVAREIKAIVGVSAGGATAGGNAPTTKEVASPGSSVAGGFAPTSAAESSAGGASADDLSASARVAVTPGGATAGGNAPSTSEAVTETPARGGATAGGFGPTAVVGVASGAATGQGNQPGTAETAGSGGAIASGNSTTTAVVGVTPGGATSGGEEPSAPLSETPTFGGATSGGNAPTAIVGVATGGALANGRTPAPTVSVTPGGATSGGNAPAVPLYETPVFGGATASGRAPGVSVTSAAGGATGNGTSPSASSTPTPGGATAIGNAISSSSEAGVGGATTGDFLPTATVGVPPGGAIAKGVEESLFEDDFNRADEDLTTPWVSTGGDTAKIVGGVVVNETLSGDALLYYDSAASSNDQFSEVTLTEDGQSGPAVRVGGTFGSRTAYFIVPGGFTNLYKFIEGAGNYQPINSTGIVSYSNGDVLRLEVEGTTLRTFTNGVEDPNSPYTDSSISTGQPGVRVWTGSLDDWSGGDLTGGIKAIVGVDRGGATSGGHQPVAPLSEQPIFGGATAGGNAATPAALVDQGGVSTGGGSTTVSTALLPGGAIAGGRTPVEIGVTPPAPVGPTPGSGATKRVRIHKTGIEYLDEELPEEITEDEEEALLLLSLSLE